MTHHLKTQNPPIFGGFFVDYYYILLSPFLMFFNDILWPLICISGAKVAHLFTVQIPILL